MIHSRPLPAPPDRKILTLEELRSRFRRPRDRKLVFTNGCFDILHRGHVEYLFAARALGDTLVVAVNSDASVARLKGPTRPINSEDDRAVVIAALAAVDFVLIFEEDTPQRVISTLLPDVLVKGGDYQVDTIVGAEEVRAAGGDVVVIPLVPGRSTTGVLERARGGSAP